MATRRPNRKHQPQHDAARRPEPIDEDLALAEELLRLAREDQATVATESRKFRKFLRQLGIHGKPIGAKKLRERLLQEGFDPEGNEFKGGLRCPIVTPAAGHARSKPCAASSPKVTT